MVIILGQNVLRLRLSNRYDCMRFARNTAKESWEGIWI